MMNSYTLSLQQLDAAHKEFEKNEPRDLFYRVAIELIELSLQKKTKLNVTEALGVLLQTWNKAFYRFRPFDEQHFSEIESVVNANVQILLKFRQRSIDAYCDKDEQLVRKLFGYFEAVLGPVGAAKSMHLFAPMFFPLWDRAIAKAYGVALKHKGENASRYVRFLTITKQQVEQLSGGAIKDRNLLKAIDEYNYCKYTKKWHTISK